MSERVPEGWDKKRLSDFSTARRGTTYVSSELSEDKERFPLYINMKSFKVGGGYSENGDKYFTSPYSPNQLVQDNDLLIANTDVTDSCDILGAPAYVPREKLKNDVLFSHHVSALNISDDVSLDFLNFLMCSEHIRLEMKQYGRGTTVKMLDMRDIGKISLCIPPLPEQKKIASILTSVDEVIEKTQSQIDKLQDLKKATMNELLTKGIGHTEFKDSELGRIPRSWEVKSLSKIKLDISDGNYSNKYPTSNEFVEEGVPFLRANNIGTLEVYPNDIRYITLEKHEQLKKGHLKRNDILISTRGEIGKLCLVQDKFISANINAQIVRINGGGEINRLFLFYILSSSSSKKQFKDLQTGTALKQLPVGNLLKLQIPLIPHEEQKKIGETLRVMDAHIVKLEIKKKQIQSLKKSLMQDLLTGKVRVSVN